MKNIVATQQLETLKVSWYFKVLQSDFTNRLSVRPFFYLSDSLSV